MSDHALHNINDIEALIQKINDDLDQFYQGPVVPVVNVPAKTNEISADIKTLSDSIDNASIDNINLDNMKIGTRINQSRKMLQCIKIKFNCITEPEKIVVVPTDK